MNALQARTTFDDNQFKADFTSLYKGEDFGIGNVEAIDALLQRVESVNPGFKQLPLELKLEKIKTVLPAAQQQYKQQTPVGNFFSGLGRAFNPTDRTLGIPGDNAYGAGEGLGGLLRGVVSGVGAAALIGGDAATAGIGTPAALAGLGGIAGFNAAVAERDLGTRQRLAGQTYNLGKTLPAALVDGATTVIPVPGGSLAKNVGVNAGIGALVDGFSQHAVTGKVDPLQVAGSAAIGGGAGAAFHGVSKVLENNPQLISAGVNQFKKAGFLPEQQLPLGPGFGVLGYTPGGFKRLKPKAVVGDGTAENPLKATVEVNAPVADNVTATQPTLEVGVAPQPAVSTNPVAGYVQDLINRSPSGVQRRSKSFGGEDNTPYTSQTQGFYQDTLLKESKIWLKNPEEAQAFIAGALETGDHETRTIANIMAQTINDNHPDPVFRAATRAIVQPYRTVNAQFQASSAIAGNPKAQLSGFLDQAITLAQGQKPDSSAVVAVWFQKQVKDLHDLAEAFVRLVGNTADAQLETPVKIDHTVSVPEVQPELEEVTQFFEKLYTEEGKREFLQYAMDMGRDAFEFFWNLFPPAVKRRFSELLHSRGLC